MYKGRLGTIAPRAMAQPIGPSTSDEAYNPCPLLDSKEGASVPAFEVSGMSDVPTNSKLRELCVLAASLGPEIFCASIISAGYFYAMASHAHAMWCTFFAGYALTILFVWSWWKLRNSRNSD